MNEIFIERQDNIFRIAIKKNNELKECYIEEETFEPLPGEIYRGIVKNIVPGIKCAFIDIGYKTNCYMYLDKKFRNLNIKKGEEVMVQVLKEPLNKKGAKVTNAVSIPGRYCVLNVLDNKLKFSKKINDDNFIEYVKNNINKPDDVGLMIRTKSEDVPIETLNDEINNIYKKYLEVKNKMTYSPKIGLLMKGNGILGKILRDKLGYENTKIYINNSKDYEYIKKYIDNLEDINVELILHKDKRELLDYYGIENEILKLRKSKVSLKCGGYIVIDKTEAMYVIDINSGKNTKSVSIKDTAFITNKQAAMEIVNQIKLRNLSGIILIDFIDMQEEDKKKEILKILRNGFSEDKSKVVVYPFTELNLVQITRRRMGKVLYEYIDEPCKICNGKGRRIKMSYVEFLIKNEVRKDDSMNHVYIELNKIYEKEVKENLNEFIKKIGASDKNIYLKFSNTDEVFKVEYLVFKSQIEKLKSYKV
ncbi:Rne/Rng family ribonuclease [Clostridium cochlearium]|uniref:Rne/Rng family ribonuclease n=1 Tax=Clostridium cochlearium TaxID=1494 RepID=UPI001459944D|nr:Rne/Rng family ribonuclease [Clostridium cochlearium]NME94642.1 Rne/Rng family ribonuclease [Clostridium cochlearium]